MIKVAIKDQSEDPTFKAQFQELLVTSPKYNVSWNWTLDEKQADKTYVLVDQDVENEDEWDTEQLFVSRDLLYSEPREAVHKLIKYIPQLYCVNYEVLEKILTK